jgi:hypothetical protein
VAEGASGGEAGCGDGPRPERALHAADGAAPGPDPLREHIDVVLPAVRAGGGRFDCDIHAAIVSRGDERYVTERVTRNENER